MSSLFRFKVRRVGLRFGEHSAGVRGRSRHRQHRKPAPRGHTAARARKEHSIGRRRQGLGEAGGRRGRNVQLSQGGLKIYCITVHVLLSPENFSFYFLKLR